MGSESRWEPLLSRIQKGLDEGGALYDHDWAAISDAEKAMAELREQLSEKQDNKFEAALRYLAENAFASKDWRFAQAVLNGETIQQAKEKVQHL